MTVSRIVLLLLCLGSVPAMGQIDKEGEPVSWNLIEQLEEPAVVVDLPTLNTPVLLAEDEHVNEAKSKPFRFAIAHPVGFTLQNSGQWTNLKYGDRIWRLGVRAEEAYSLSLNFDNLVIPSGALLYIYTSDQSEFFGPISSKNNNPNHILGTQPIHGSEIVIEYYEPYAVRGNGIISIASIAQGYRDLLADPPGPKSCLTPFICNNDAGLEAISNSVVMILLDKGTRAVTGTMMNNSLNDGTPYVLTSSELGDSDPSSWVFLVKMNAQECGTGETCWTRSLSGATRIASDSLAGVSLLRINENPPGKWQTYFSGWNFNPLAGDGYRCIQHALGKTQSISATHAIAGAVGWDAKDAIMIQDWYEGATFPGSLGSPLFDSEDRVCAVFLGGLGTCNTSAPDYFSNLPSTWDAFRAYLDPLHEDKLNHPGYYPGYIPEDPLADGNSIIVYPNPSNGVFSIFSVNNEPVLSFELYEMTGRILCRRSLITPQVDLREFGGGIYHLVVHFRDSSTSERIILR